MTKPGEARAGRAIERLDVLDSMPDGLMVFDSEWRIESVNAAAESTSDATRASLLGRTQWEAFPALVGSHLERELRRAMTDRIPLRVESHHEPEGRWCEVEIIPLEGGGLACFKRDVTARKRAEEDHSRLERQRDELLARLRLQFERMPIACIVGDTGLGIVEWNPAAEKLFGHRREEVLGLNGLDLLVAPSSRALAHETVQRMAAGDMTAHAVAENITKDGRTVVCEWHNTPLRSVEGEVNGYISMALDITAQKQAEDQRRKSESLLAEAQRVAHIGSYSWDLRNDEVFCSEEHYRVLGLDPDEGGLTLERSRSLVHPGDRLRVLSSIEQALRDHLPFECDWRALHDDGSIRFARSRSRVELDDAGVPIRIFGTTQDVTEQRIAERAVAETEAKFRTLADSSPAIIWALDARGALRYVNRGYLEFFGVSEEEVSGSRWKAHLHPEDAQGYIAEINSVVREHRPLFRRTRVRRRDQRWRWMESRGLPHFGEDGRYLGHVGHSLDITDQMETTAFLVESERNLAAELAGMARLQEVSTRLVQAGDSTSLLEHIVDAAIAITDADMGTIQLFDPDSETLKIVASRGLDHAFLDAFSALPGCQGCSGGAAQIGERVVIEDITTGERADGGTDLSVFLAGGVRAMQSTPLVTRLGQPVGVLSTHYRSPRRPVDRDLRVLDLLARQAADWIERRAAQAEREQLLESERQARAEAERAAKLKDEFLATLSHELRTPLSAMLGWTDVLRDSIDDGPRVRRGVEVIRRNALAQVQLIEDLIDLSRVITGKMRLDMEPVALAAIIDSAVESVRPAADARRIGILTVIEPIATPVHGDPARLRQILWNLLSNAVKFTPAGGRVEVFLAQADAGVEITVSDTGKGIAAGFLPHVFERFRQADSSAAREHGGLGIGLALVKQIAELHGGQVSAFSPGEGMGSTFVLSLPTAIEPAVEEPHQSKVLASGLRSDERSPPLDGIKVLVVDDEADALEVIQHILEDRRVEVAIYRSVDSALDALENQQFDVLVSDIAMPRRDGYEFIAEVRRRGIKTPAAALSAFARSEDRTRALLSGYQVHLAKPLESSELVATVASLAGRISRHV